MKVKRKFGIVVLVASFATLLVSVSAVSVYAQTVTANIPIVNLEVPIGETAQVSGLAQYIQIFYRFTVAATAIIAASMIMFAGVSWLTAAGSSQKIGEAKERITAAISGLVLAMLSYAILNTINPQLISLQTPSIVVPEVTSSLTNPFSTSAVSSAASGNYCPSGSDWVNIYTTLGQTSSQAASIYQTNHASTNQGLLEADVVPKLATAILAADQLGMTLYVNGDSRSFSTQQYLYDCYTNSLASGTCNCSSCNLAARPDCNSSPHLLGRALDLAWYPKSTFSNGVNWYDLRGYAKTACNNGGCVSGTTKTYMAASQARLQTMMQSVGFTRICKEWWHFEYLGPSTQVCQPGQYQ